MAPKITTMDLLDIPKKKAFSFFLYYLLSRSRFSFSRTKARLLRKFGATVGENVYFAPRSFLFCFDFEKTKIGDGVQFKKGVQIFCGSLIAGDDARFDQDVLVKGRSSLKVGRGCYIGLRTYIDLNEDVIIEDDAGVGPGCWIWTHSVWQPVTEGGPRNFGPVYIKEGAWVPSAVFILPSVTIGEKAIVAGNSAVVKDIPPGALAGGNPAKIIRTAEEMKKEITLEEKYDIVSKILNDYIVWLKQNHHTSVVEEKTAGECKITTLETPKKGIIRAKTRSWGIMFVKTVTDQVFKELYTLCIELDKVILISLYPITEKSIQKLNNERFSKVTWFDIENRMRKKDWDWESTTTHGLFRRNYGIRFRFYPSNND